MGQRGHRGCDNTCVAACRGDERRGSGARADISSTSVIKGASPIGTVSFATATFATCCVPFARTIPEFVASRALANSEAAKLTPKIARTSSTMTPVDALSAFLLRSRCSFSSRFSFSFLPKSSTMSSNSSAPSLLSPFLSYPSIRSFPEPEALFSAAMLMPIVRAAI